MLDAVQSLGSGQGWEAQRSAERSLQVPLLVVESGIVDVEDQKCVIVLRRDDGVRRSLGKKGED